MYSTNDAWYDYRFSLLEAFTLPSIEANKEKDLYWLILMTEDLPAKYRRRLNQIIDNSSVRENTYILDIRFPSDLRKVFRKFIDERIEPDEWRIEMRMDGDDMLAAGIFAEVEQIANENPETPMLLTFRDDVYHYIHANKSQPTVYPFLALDTFLITNDLDFHPYMTQHTKMGEAAGEKGIEVHIIESNRPKWAYSIFPASDSHVRNGYREPNGSMTTLDVFQDLGVTPNLKALSEFYHRYPAPCKALGRLGGHHSFTMKCNEISRELTNTKKLWQETVDYNDLKKPALHKVLSDAHQKHGRWLDAVNEVYDMKLQYDDELLKITDGRTYMNTICEISENDKIVVLFSTKFATQSGIGAPLGSELCYCGYFLNGEITYETNTEPFLFNSFSLKDRKLDFFDIASTCQPEICESSIAFRFVEYSLNLRGLNIVILDPEKQEVIDSVNIDIQSEELTLTR